jgi:nitric oxide synthase-interacting protein
MTKHSKNNTASSIFSYAEYKKLDYGTKRQRLGNESMKSFNACSLCLERARIPVACSEGHLFCTECVYSDLREHFIHLLGLAFELYVSYTEQRYQETEEKT